MNTNNEGWNTDPFQKSRLDLMGLILEVWLVNGRKRGYCAQSFDTMKAKKMVSEEYLYVHGHICNLFIMFTIDKEKGIILLWA